MMARFSIRCLFLLVCGLYSVVWVSWFVFHMWKDSSAKVNYNSRHSYDQVGQLFSHKIFLSSSENHGIGDGAKDDKKPSSESHGGFKNLAKEELSHMHKSEGEGKMVSVVWGEGSNVRPKENVSMNLVKRKKLFEKTNTSEFLINPPNVCEEDILLLILVHSLPGNDQQRNAVRNTYGKNLTQILERMVKVVFFCPGTSPTKAVVSKMTKESLENNDLVHSKVANSTKVFKPSSKAMLLEFKWVKTYCPSAKFILFANDEQFVNVEGLVRMVKRQENKDLNNFYLGRVKRGAKPNRSPKDEEYAPEFTFPGEQYPNFCNVRAGMVLSNAFINSVYNATVQYLAVVKAFPLSDVMLGIVANKLKKPPMYNDEFRKIGGEGDYCDLKDALVLGDFNKPSLLTGVWANFTEHKQDSCPNPVPNATEIEEWTNGVDHGPYLEEVLRLIHNPEETCLDDNGDNKVFLLALVTTHPDHYELRDAIRRTWAEPKYQDRLKMKTLFVMARPRIENPDKIERTKLEFEEHNDLIQAEFRESFHKLTLKVILGLRWATMYCPGASFVYRGDDDMLVNFERLTNYLRTLPPKDGKELFLGHMMTNSPVVRTLSRYQTKRTQYPFRYFLPYVSGGGYIMAQQALQKMYKKALTTKFIPMEDAYAGILAFRSGIRLNHSERFITTGVRKDHCMLKTAFNLHGFKNASIMISSWKEFTHIDSSKTCDGH